MVNDRNPVSCPSAVIGREKIAFDDLHMFAGIELIKRLFQSGELAGGPNETANISKAVVKECTDYSRSDKATGTGD
jgi:hypothetical protein